MSEIAAETFRTVLGHFATGLTIITGTTAEGPRGFTCQSFSALSLNPPLVVVMPSRTSTSWPQIETTKSFCVNVLSARQRDVSAAFGSSGADKFAGVEWDHTPSGLPRLAHSSAWIECTIEDEYPGGDHLIVVGRVRNLGVDTECSDPLIFHRGAYSDERLSSSVSAVMTVSRSSS